MMHAAQRLLYGGMQHNPPSRFLSEIDGEQVREAPEFGGYNNFGGGFEQPAMPPKAQSMEPRVVPLLEEGDGVKHSLFGMGTILELDGDMATIYFKGKGTKKMDISIAPLEKLS